MRDTIRQLRNLEKDIDALARQVDHACRPDTVDLFCAALQGDSEAAAELQALGADGRAGHLHEALDAILEPLEAAGGALVADEDLIRPEGA